MPKFVIRVEKNTDFIDDAFKDMGQVSKLTKIQLKVFLAVYKSKLNGLYLMLRNRVKQYIVKETKKCFTASDTGNLEYVKRAKKNFELFMYGDEKILKSDKKYQEYKNDRIVDKVVKNIKRGAVGSKDKAISAALAGGRVFDFLLRSGLIITWRLEGDD